MSRPCLIAYDIAEPRRLKRLHRGLSRFAMPLQYSVFYADLSDAGLARVVSLIERIIKPKADDVRVYLLPNEGWTRFYGVRPLPAGIVFLGLPRSLARQNDEPRESPESPETSPPERRLPRPVVDPAQRRQARSLEARTPTGQRKGFRIL